MFCAVTALNPAMSAPDAEHAALSPEQALDTIRRLSCSAEAPVSGLTVAGASDADAESSAASKGNSSLLLGPEAAQAAGSARFRASHKDCGCARRRAGITAANRVPPDVMPRLGPPCGLCGSRSATCFPLLVCHGKPSRPCSSA